MADYNKFDARVDSLVTETKTVWDGSIGALAEDDRRWLAEAIHQAPQLASKVHYERMHTGFTREITVTAADIERLYRQRLS